VNDAAVAGAWVEWLRTMRWDFFATCTWEKPVAPHHVVAAVIRWLQPLPAAYGTIGVQRGPHAAKVHAHVLIGGIGRHPLRETLLRGSWIRAGHVNLVGYSPLKGGVEYLCRQADEIEIIGTPLPFRPRR